MICDTYQIASGNIARSASEICFIILLRVTQSRSIGKIMTTNALIVDDSRLACKVLANMLDPLNIRSVAVYSAEQALEYLQNHQPDIIFLDHTMPGMDGLETIKVIKSNPLTATVPVMMYTAKEGEVYVGQARALGAVDVLPKGLEKDYLLQALQKLGMVESQTEKPEVPKKISPQKRDLKKDVVAKVESEAVPDPLWQKIWQHKIEPFLNRHKAYQAEELILTTQKQTRLLTREIHRTLENFEHALAQRMESHDDFLAAKREVQKQKRRRWLAAGIASIVGLQVFLVFQLYSMRGSNDAILVEQRNIKLWQSQATQQFDAMQVQLKQLDTPPSIVEEQSPQITLKNASMEHMAEVFPTASGRGDFRAVTPSGYQFFVNAQGEIISHLGTRFFLTENCQGDVFVTSRAGSVLKANDESLWYVDKLSEVTPVNVKSQLTSIGECKPLADVLVNLHQLQPNMALETGVDEMQTGSLVFN